MISVRYRAVKRRRCHRLRITWMTPLLWPVARRVVASVALRSSPWSCVRSSSGCSGHWGGAPRC